MIRKLFKLAFAALLTAGALSVNAATVVLSGTSGSSCTYSSVAFAADGTMTVTCSGGGGLTSQTITFGSAPAISAGGTGTVSATASSGLAVTFASAPSNVCTNSGSTVSGVAAGSCTITASQSGNASYSAATATQNLTVGSGGGGGSCAGVTVPASISNLDIYSGVGGGATSVTPDSGFGNYAVKSYRFTTAAGKYGTANFGFEDTSGIPGDFYGKLVAISTCPGDFTGIGVTAGSGLPCYVNNPSAQGGIYYQVGATGTPLLCKLDTNTQYYLNIKNSVQGSTMKYLFKTEPATAPSP